MKIGIIVDSSVGLTKEETEKRGWKLIPLIFNIDGKDYNDGFDMDAKTFYKNLSIEQEVRTSATPPAKILEAYEEMSKIYDHVIVYGISKGLSGQTNNLTVFAKDFPNVHVVESNGVGALIAEQVEEILEFSKTAKNIDEVMEFANKITKDQYGIVLPATMKWLVKGGRVSPVIARLASLLNVVPMIALDKGVLEKHGKGKKFEPTLVQTCEYLKTKLDFNKKVFVYHSESPKIKELTALAEKVLECKLEIVYFPPIIAVHVGPGAVCFVGHRIDK